MRVTFLLPDPGNLAGGNRVTAQHAAHLRDAGHVVTAIGRPRAKPPAGPMQRLKRLIRGRTPIRWEGDGHFATHGVPVRRLDPGARPRPQDLPDADVIVASWWETVEWAADMPARKGTPVHFMQEYEVFDRQDKDRARAVYDLPFFKIAVARWLQDQVLALHGAPSHLCPNGVDLTQFRFAPRARSAPPTVGFLYTKAPRKNVGLALEAIEIARRARPELEALSFGRSDFAAPAPDRIRHTIRPDQAEIPGIYGACDAWLFPSKSEGFGLPILEAMACGAPVLATGAGAAPDLIDGRNGRVLPDDPQAFADAILALLALPAEEWEAMSAAARATAEANDVVASSTRFETLLRQAADGG